MTPVKLLDTSQNTAPLDQEDKATQNWIETQDAETETHKIKVRERPFFPTDFKIRTMIGFLLTHPPTPEIRTNKRKNR